MKRIGISILLLTLTQPFPVLPRPTAHGESPSPPDSAHVPVEEIELDNGLTLLLVHRPESPTVAAGWMVPTGSADDPTHQTGLSHLLEHLMFKGSRTVGTRNLAEEMVALAEIDRLWEEKQVLLTKLDRAPPKKRQKLEDQLGQTSVRLQAAQNRARSLAYLGHYSFLYSQQGGTGLNANTYRDLTLYYLTLPREKLELWFWLESDRLLTPVFRQFYKEIDVILEERRQRIDSTPTGPLDEELRTLFWDDHPYSWNPMGSPDHLARISRQDALDFFHRHYRADRMTLALVGGFDPEQVMDWARRYFGRLPVGAPAADTGSPAHQPPARTREGRMEATCNCPPQLRIQYPSASFGHPDSYALQLLSAVLNGRTGRLYRSLVLGEQIAFSAFTQQISWRQTGEFSFRAESKGDIDPQQLLSAWDRQVDRLRTETPTPAEIQRALNRSGADAYRSLKEPAALMKQLLIYQGLGDWRHLNNWVTRMQGVTSADLSRVVTTYLQPDRRTVALYRRSKVGTQP